MSNFLDFHVYCLQPIPQLVGDPPSTSQGPPPSPSHLGGYGAQQGGAYRGQQGMPSKTHGINFMQNDSFWSFCVGALLKSN